MSENPSNGNGQNGRRNSPGEGRLPATTGWRGAVNSFLDGLFGRLPADDHQERETGPGGSDGPEDRPANQPAVRQ